MFYKNKVQAMRFLCVLTAFVLFHALGVYAQKQTKESIASDLRKHEKAVNVYGATMRDPFITLAPDGFYYLSCTRPLKTFPNELPGMQFFRSSDLINWEKLNPIWEARDSNYGSGLIKTASKRGTIGGIWAPEVHFIDGKWVVINTSNMRMANLMVTKGKDITGPYREVMVGANYSKKTDQQNQSTVSTELMGLNMGFHRDPSIFIDDDKTPWLISGAAELYKLKSDLSGFEGYHKLIGPEDRLIGHEGVYIIKVGNKYVMFGTGWSTDIMRKGTYNLYYCVADKVTGPYGPRKFAGRYLGHGTPFKDKDGRWWSTAFYNADNPTITPLEASKMDLSKSAYSINQGGLTLVPMEIYEENGDVIVKAKDEAYRYPGNDELQKFEIK